MAFDRDEFVTECRAALVESDVAAAVAEVVRRQVVEGAAIDDAFVGVGSGPFTLYSSAELTVQRITWSPGFVGAPHDHRMWATVGVYWGAERNRLHRRTSAGLE